MPAGLPLLPPSRRCPGGRAPSRTNGPRSAGWVRLLAMVVPAGILLAMATACVHPRRGLVRVESDVVVLETPDGSRHHIDPTGAGRLLAGLDGCEVEVEARGRRVLRVRDWEILAGPDGSQPYIGRLHTGGGSWLLDDRNTGGTLWLDLSDAVGLSAHAGELVVVSGYVEGPQRIHVVWWTALPDAPASGPASGDDEG